MGSATAVAAGGSCGGGKDEEVEKPPMKEPCEWTKMEVQYFLIAVGFDKRKCEEFKSAGVTGKVLVKISKAELESDYGCSSAEIKTFQAALKFSIEVTETECGNKPAEEWTEIEVQMVMISIGLGTKCEKVHKHHITGAKVIKMDTIKLQDKCNMTGSQVTKFKAVVGVSVTVTGKSNTGGGRPKSPDSHSSRSRSSSSSSRSSCGGKKKGGAVKVTKTTVTKTTTYAN